MNPRVAALVDPDGPTVIKMHDGQSGSYLGYLESYDPEAHGGRGYATMTGDITKALRFKSTVEAWELWKLQSETLPTRPDGKPNRPLTYFHVELNNEPSPRSP